MSKNLAKIEVIRAANLESLDLGWLRLKDHFISTVGPRSGQGEKFGHLLVLADAYLQAQTSFPIHPHKEMEILTWVASGQMNHHDNIGTSALIEQHTLQMMSARDGILHAEGNRANEELRLLQIWIQPDEFGGTPVFGTARVQKSGFNLLAGPKDAPLVIRQNVWLYISILNHESCEIEIPEGKVGYAVAINDLVVNSQRLKDGDGIKFNTGTVHVEGTGQVVLLVQDLE